MITTNNVYTIDMPQIFDNAAKEVTDRQRRVAGQLSVRKTGYLASSLQGNSSVESQNNTTTLTITYPVYLRYLDMQYRGKGPKRKQKKKAPIYNKLIYGFLQGYIYSRLRGGLVRYMAERIQNTKIEI